MATGQKPPAIRVFAGHTYIRLDVIENKGDWLFKAGAILKCDGCGIEFYRPRHLIRAHEKKGRTGVYCSRRCFGSVSSGIRRGPQPKNREFDYEKIVAMRAAGMMLWEIAAKIGCSMATVNKVVYCSQEGKALVRTGQGNWSKRHRMAKKDAHEYIRNSNSPAEPSTGAAYNTKPN